MYTRHPPPLTDCTSRKYSCLTGILFSGVAGIMLYIRHDRQLPGNRKYGKGYDSLFGFVGGILVIASNLLLMK
jgi:ZIP family zinc transporter